jgi:hypothetical protein
LSTSCKWANDGIEPEFETQTGTVDANKWLAATGTSTTPTGEFLMVIGEQGQGPAVLRSESIACQTGDGLVALSAWMSQGVVMKVCLEDTATKQQIFCQQLDRAAGPSYAVIIPGDIKEGTIVISAENWGTGAMAAVDNVEYMGTMCSQLMIANPSTTMTPYTGAPIGIIASNAELACTVDNPAACQWGDPDTTHQWWWVDNVDAAKLQALTGTSQVPTSGAAYYEFPAANEYAFFGSDELFCVESDGDLVFNVWSTSGVQLEVCAVIYSEGREVCKPPVSVVSPGPAAFPFTKAELGNSGFVFVVTAYTSTHPAFIMIDNIAFTGAICTEPNLKTIDEESCEALSTSFNDLVNMPPGWHECTTGCPAGLALERIAPTSDILGKYNIRVKGPVVSTKPHLGVSLIKEMNTAGQDQGEMHAILQSVDFHFDTARWLSFTYQRGTFGSQIYICRNQVPSMVRRDIPFGHPDCTKIAGPQIAADPEWISGAQGGFLIQPTDQRLYFVFDAPWKYSYGDAHFVIDDILIHEGTTAETPPLCLPLN